MYQLLPVNGNDEMGS